jgi:hypothetical protein
MARQIPGAPKSAASTQGRKARRRLQVILLGSFPHVAAVDTKSIITMPQSKAELLTVTAPAAKPSDGFEVSKDEVITVPHA